MKVRPLRLLSQLAADGFSVGWLENRAHEFGLVRHSAVPDLFELLIVKAVGKRSDAVFAEVAASVVRGPMATKGLIETELLLEVATDAERGWAIVTNGTDAVNWERRLVSVVADRLRELVETRGPALLERTARARHAVHDYSGHLPKMKSIGGLERWLSERCTPEQRREAMRLAEWPGVMAMWGGESLYRAVTLCIAHYGAEVEGPAAAALGSDPLRSPELMWRIQILADVLLTEYGLDAEALRASTSGPDPIP